MAALLEITGWLLIYYGIVPWTRLIAVSSLLWVTWPLPGGLNRSFEGRLRNLVIKTTSQILDLFQFSHLATAENIDLKACRINIEAISGGLDSILLVSFFALCVLIYSRRPLLLGVISLASVPLIHWSGQTIYLLFQVIAAETYSSQMLLEGWPLFVVRSCTVFLECLGVVAVIRGWSYLFDQVPVDSAEQAKKGLQGLYNQACLWPMNVVINLSEDEQAYFDDNMETKNRETIRKLPRFRLTEASLDPWLASRFYVPCLVVTGLTFVLGLIAWIVPQPTVSRPSLLNAGQIEALVAANPFDDSTRFVGAEHTEIDEVQLIAWNLEFDQSGLYSS